MTISLRADFSRVHTLNAEARRDRIAFLTELFNFSAPSPAPG
jgi:hypothetical protein